MLDTVQRRILIGVMTLVAVVALVLHAGLASGADSRAQATPPASSPDQPQIIGGQEAAPGAWPWMVALVQAGQPNAYDGLFCGGTLIAPQWVLTAAHCVHTQAGSLISPQSIDVVAGRHDLTATGGERIDVTQIIPHPTYNAATYDNDLALLRLAQPSQQSPAALIPASNTTLVAPGVSATVMGWGNTSTVGDVYPERLQQVALPIVSNEVCAAGNVPYGITANMLCAGPAAGGQDACQGDSGGPLVVRNNTGSGWVQAGIVSWGIGCAEKNRYGVYTRLSRYVNWIADQTGDLWTPTPTTTGPTPTKTATPSPTPTATATPLLDCRQYASNDTPKPIPDNQAAGVTSSISVPDGFTVYDVNVTLNIQHSYVDDLKATLAGPNSTRVTLLDGVGGSGDNFTNTTLDDEAAILIGSGTAPFAGSYRPQEPLSNLDGQTAAGTWSLTVSDSAVLDTGQLQGWQLRLCAVQGLATATPSRTASATPSPSATSSPSATPTATGTRTVTATPTAASLSLEVGNAAVVAGQSVTVAVDLKHVEPNLAVGAITAQVGYDPQVVQATGCVVDPESAFDTGACNVAQSGQVRLTALSAGGVGRPARLANIVFAATGPAGTSGSLDLSIELLSDPGGIAIAGNPRDGMIQVVESLTRGDVNCDRSVNGVDALFVLQHDVALRQPGLQCPPATGSLYGPACDVNEDQRCGVVDALFVMQCDVGIPNPFCPSRSTSGSVGGRGELSPPISLLVVADVRHLGVMNGELRLDPALAEVVECRPDPAGRFELSACGLDPAGIVRFELVSAQGISGSIPLARITARTLHSGSLALRPDLSVQIWADPDGRPVAIEPGSVAVFQVSGQIFLPALGRD